MRRIVAAVVLGGAVFLWALGVLSRAVPSESGVVRGSAVLEDGVPVTIYVPGGEPVSGPGGVVGPPGERFPLVVLAHGFVGDRVGLRFLAESLALNGFAVVTYDAPGHGQNRNPFGSSAGPSHLKAMADVIEWASKNDSVDPTRIAVGGHSMGAATALDFAASDKRPSAVLAISGGWSVAGPERPRNAFFVYASGDPGPLKDRVRRVASKLAGVPELEGGRLYGDFGREDAVAAVELSGLDHLSIVASPETVRWTVTWLRRALGTVPDPAIGAEGEPSRTSPLPSASGSAAVLEPAADVQVSPYRGFRTVPALFLFAAVAAYWAGRLAGRLQRGEDWLPLEEKVPWRRMLGSWAVALAVGLVVAKVFGPEGVMPLGLMTGVAVILGSAGGVVAAHASLAKDAVGSAGARPRSFLAFGVSGSLLLVLLAGPISLIHNVGLDAKRAIQAALLSAGFFPGLWALEYLARRGSTLRGMVASAVLKAMVVVAVTVGIGIGALHPVMALGIPALIGVLVYFEVFAAAGARAGATPAVLGASEAVTLGWIAAALGPLQF